MPAGTGISPYSVFTLSDPGMSKAMQALRLIARPSNHQLLIELPPGLDDCLLEVIVLPAAETDPVYAVSRRRRRPAPMLAGTVTLQDDLLAPAIPDSDWEVLR